MIDVLLPFLCSYLPSWWSQGPDSADPKASGGHITMVTATHLNHLLKLVLRLIMKNIGEERAEWLTNIAVYAQQVGLWKTIALLLMFMMMMFLLLLVVVVLLLLLLLF